MAKTSEVAAPAAVPSSADIERAAKFVREPFLLDGEGPEALAPGTARRRALDAALKELDEGAEDPSIEWRRDFSLLLGLERLLADEPPKLRDGAELNPHQVDALSGTLTELMAEQQIALDGEANGNGGGAPRRSREGRRQRDAEASTAPRPTATTSGEDELEDEELAPDEEPQDWEEQPADDEETIEEAPDDPGAERRFWFEHATGAGKTVAAVGFIDASRTGGVLILTHRRNLVDQFIGEISDRGYKERLRPPLMGDRDDPDGPVTVETYQWFVRNHKKISDAYSIVICDEAHTALGEKTSACIRAWVGPVFIGMTATGALIARHVADLFPTQTSRFDLIQAARRGVISPLRCMRIPPGPGVRTIAKVPLRKGEVDQDFDQEELAALLDQEPFNVAIADLYKTRFDGMPGVLYTAGVQHAKNVARALLDAGVAARAVSGETPKRELAEILAGFERGEVDVLCNAMLLAEGWNSPRATLCMHLAPTASRRIYQQRVGRVTRRAPGKEAGLVIDFVHPATTHDETIVTLHSLLDRDVYRGGAIVIGPVRRARGRRIRVERRIVPVADSEERRMQVLERELWRIAVENLDYAEQHAWAALAGARVNPQGWRRGRAILQGSGSKELKPPLPAHLRAAQPQLAAETESAERDRRPRRRRGLRRRDRHRRHLEPRGQAGGDENAAAGAGRQADRPPRPGAGVGLAARLLHPRAARRVCGAALAGDEAAARPAGQFLGPGARAQRAPAGPLGPQTGPPPRGGAAGRRGLAHARGRRGAARRPHADGPQALGDRPRAAAQLPQRRQAALKRGKRKGREGRAARRAASRAARGQGEARAKRKGRSRSDKAKAEAAKENGAEVEPAQRRSWTSPAPRLTRSPPGMATTRLPRSSIPSATPEPSSQQTSRPRRPSRRRHSARTSSSLAQTQWSLRTSAAVEGLGGVPSEQQRGGSVGTPPIPTVGPKSETAG